MAGFSTRALQHSYLNLDGTPASGSAEIQLTGAMRNAGVSYVASLPIVTTLDANGNLSVTVPANNDPGTIPDGVGYILTEKIAGASEATWNISVPAGAGPIDLASLLPSQAV